MIPFGYLAYLKDEYDELLDVSPYLIIKTLSLDEKYGHNPLVTGA